jgi:hypothetical protein
MMNATPVDQILAAVAVPRTEFFSCRMAPPPIKPTPVIGSLDNTGRGFGIVGRNTFRPFN